MTTCFDNKDWAIKHGLYCVGRWDLYKDGKKERKLEEILKLPDVTEIKDGNIEQFGFVHKDCTMIKVKNCKGKDVLIASTKFRDGFDCWLLDPETGMGMRVKLEWG